MAQCRIGLFATYKLRFAGLADPGSPSSGTYEDSFTGVDGIFLLEPRNSRCLLQLRENLVGCSDVGNRTAHLAKHFLAILIDDECSSKGDIFVLVSLRVEQTIFAYDGSAWVAKNCDVAMGRIFPNLARVILVVHADGHHPRILGVEVRFSLRELAQLLYAEGSPVAAIKVQNNFVPALL